MGLLDQFEGILQNELAQRGGIQGVLGQAFQGAGGYDGILAKLKQAGLGDQVASWLGPNSNLPVTAAQIEAALGDQHLQQLAASMGIPLNQVASVLAQHLPAAVDQASPNGVIVPPAVLNCTGR
jgi:uncharacterized protein YidB (DUF937 family)